VSLIALESVLNAGLAIPPLRGVFNSFNWLLAGLKNWASWREVLRVEFRVGHRGTEPRKQKMTAAQRHTHVLPNSKLKIQNFAYSNGHFSPRAGFFLVPEYLIRK
jgi:hypothetical protein